MKKNGTIIIILSFLIMVVAIFTAVYAWFSLVEKTQPIIIYSGKIELNAKLYDEDDNEINSLTIDKVVPGDVFNYKLVIKNEGTILGNLETVFNFKVSNNNLKSFIIFDIDDLNLNNDSTTFVSSSYTYLNQLDKDDVITIYFSITISEDLELTDLSGNDVVEIITINIKLTQAD